MRFNPIYPPEPCLCGAEDCEFCYPRGYLEDPYEEDPDFVREDVEPKLDTTIIKRS